MLVQNLPDVGYICHTVGSVHYERAETSVVVHELDPVLKVRGRLHCGRELKKVLTDKHLTPDAVAGPLPGETSLLVFPLISYLLCACGL